MGEAFIINKTKLIIEDGTPPEYTYTGDSELVWDDDIHWRLKLTSSGVLTFTKLGSAKVVDIFLVGGGGGGGGNNTNNSAGCGGGGGYTKTHRQIMPTENFECVVTIGAGGTAGGSAYGDKTATDGGTSSIKIGDIVYSAFGGTRGSGAGSSVDGTSCGGSGGGITANGVGGSDGGNGGNATATRGLGQGTTTREFEEPTGDLYAGGGGAGHNAAGGAGGGGTAAQTSTGNTATAGEDGLGGGGPGGSYYGPGGKRGGSGIIILRNARK